MFVIAIALALIFLALLGIAKEIEKLRKDLMYQLQFSQKYWAGIELNRTLREKSGD